MSNTSRTFSPDVANGPNTYTVKAGESLWLIAKASGWDYNALKAANPQLTDPNFINVGQKINGLGAPNLYNLYNTDYQFNQLRKLGLLSDNNYGYFAQHRQPVLNHHRLLIPVD